jgi:UDP-N-acetyl-D-mannosaminuronate dehydrogenase
MLALEAGYEVLGVDLDRSRVDHRCGGESYVGDIDDLGNDAWTLAVTPSAETVRTVDAVVVLSDRDDVDYQLVERESCWIIDCRNRPSANAEFL